uniref:uncharacterized protein LOC120816026 isoform X3 n=1 Tax=Gasterosteus aculeatus aculeatus TaxID=481459 RepID=UPI001A98E3E1|nr:uncharacterized protein LOC120816026 isoform X3 [Gasterosteus aculeatus aculeatus]
MRPSPRRRAAAWLLALPSGRGGEECARRGRLEMISFWLLCWKLLRATAGLRRTPAELTDGNPDNDNYNDSARPGQSSDPVTMESSSSPPATHTDSENSGQSLWGDQEAEEHHYTEVHGLKQPIGDEQDEEEAAGKENVVRDADECDYLVFAIGERNGNDKGDESGQDTGRGGDKVEDGERGETEGKEEGSGATVREDGGRGGEKEEDECIGETVGEMSNDAPSKLLLISCSPERLSSSEPLMVPSCPSEQPMEAMLQEALGHNIGERDDLSDVQHTGFPQAEVASVYSDSDAGDGQWASFARCDVTNQEEAGGGIHNTTCEGESKEEEGGGADKGRAEEQFEAEEASETQDQREEEEEEEEGSRHVDDEEQMTSRRDLFPRTPSVSSTGSSTEPDRKAPVDLCVQEEAHSGNVSTEHVDFLLARQQWRKMEEEVKGQPIPKPGLRAQGSFQGTHSSLYPPTRSPRLKHREIHPAAAMEPTLSSTLSSTLSPGSEDSGLEEPESAVEREIRRTLEREECHRRERGGVTQGLTVPRASTGQSGRSPPRPPACRTPTLSISPSPSSSLPRSVYHEMTANNVIILEPGCSGSTSRNLLLSSATDWPLSQDAVPSANVIVVETSNVIIRSASEFCLSSAPVSAETQESTFSSNPFFKLRSISSQSLVEREIRMVRQREEEWRRQREEMWRRRREEEWRRGRERYDTVLVSPGLSDNISYNVPEVLDRCVSSPSSPSRTRKMERSSMSCDHKLD